VDSFCETSSGRAASASTSGMVPRPDTCALASRFSIHRGSESPCAPLYLLFIALLPLSESLAGPDLFSSALGPSAVRNQYAPTAASQLPRSIVWPPDMASAPWRDRQSDPSHRAERVHDEYTIRPLLDGLHANGDGASASFQPIGELPPVFVTAVCKFHPVRFQLCMCDVAGVLHRPIECARHACKRSRVSRR
jgi:hypothetical protein